MTVVFGIVIDLVTQTADGSLHIAMAVIGLAVADHVRLPGEDKDLHAVWIVVPSAVIFSKGSSANRQSGEQDGSDVHGLDGVDWFGRPYRSGGVPGPGPGIWF